jgi:pimeloyl-ACP methyl ester carboxylesterase
MNPFVRIGQRKRKGPNPLRLVTSALATSVGAWVLYSNTQINHNVPLADAIPANRESFNSPTAGRLNYYVDRSGDGHPLLLLHSINAAASAYEMRPLFEAFRGKRPVYALDWSGYGFSERADRAYSPQFFQDALAEFMAAQFREPIDVIALSLGCEFAARAAFEHADLFRSLVFISPSGLNRRQEGSGSLQTQNAGISDTVYSVFSFPLWGRPLFDLIATRKSIKYFLRKSFVGPVPEEMIDYAYATAHQPGAEYVPLHFLSGKLFTRDIAQRVYPALQTPTLVIYDRDAYTRFDALPDVLEANAKWRACKVEPSLGLPHWEQLDATINCLRQFWDGR